MVLIFLISKSPLVPWLPPACLRVPDAFWVPLVPPGCLLGASGCLWVPNGCFPGASRPWFISQDSYSISYSMIPFPWFPPGFLFLDTSCLIPPPGFLFVNSTSRITLQRSLLHDCYSMVPPPRFIHDSCCMVCSSCVLLHHCFSKTRRHDSSQMIWIPSVWGLAHESYLAAFNKLRGASRTKKTRLIYVWARWAHGLDTFVRAPYLDEENTYTVP